MKLIHVPFCFYPDAVGGTEVYVEGLVRAQMKAGDDVMVAAPGGKRQAYSYHGLRVRRFAVAAAVSDLRELYGEGDIGAARQFGEMLDEERPDLVHLHAFTRGVSLRIVREAKRREVPVVFSYHTPTVSCQRGTLLRWGADVCAGTLDVHACAACALHGHGAGKLAARLAGSLPAATGRLLHGVSGGIWTALRMTELVELRQTTFRGLMAEVNHVVALAAWVRELLIRNGVEAEKIKVSRQGLCHAGSGGGRESARDGMRVAFLGRMDRTKGAHLLISALRRRPGLEARLDVYGVVQGEDGASYLAGLKRMAGEDRRIGFHDALPADAVVERLQEYDVLAVPSQILETGPMVVLEAFAAGIPVVGSKLGGIAETVTDGADGLLVEPHDSVEAWGSALARLVEDRTLAERLRRGVKPPRTISESAMEMCALYETILSSQSHSVDVSA